MFQSESTAVLRVEFFSETARTPNSKKFGRRLLVPRTQECGDWGLIERIIARELDYEARTYGPLTLTECPDGMLRTGWHPEGGRKNSLARTAIKMTRIVYEDVRLSPRLFTKEVLELTKARAPMAAS